MYGLNTYDQGARQFGSIIPRTTTQDPLAEKYYETSPYAQWGNNPVRYIDVNGDSISVSQENRVQFSNSLNAIFGNYSQDFSYTSTGMLTYNGSTKGMSKNQKATLKGMQKVMNETTTTNIVFGESVQIINNNGNTKTLYASDGGGAFISLASENSNYSQNTILVNPAISQTTVNLVTDAYYITPIDPANGARFKGVTTIQTNVTDATFHEIGHVIYQGQAQDKVLDYNNNIRKILGFPKRFPDEEHNRIKY